MPNLDLPRSTMLFEESIKSKYTKKNYSQHLKEFERYSGLDGTKILAVTQEQLQKAVEDYLIHLKYNTNPNSVSSKFQGIRHFCTMNQINLDWNIIYKMFPQKQKPQCMRSYTTDEIKHILANTKNIRDTALIHFLASTGARIGAFDHSLTISHIKKMPARCCAIRIYADCVEEYWAFLTPQASEALYTYHDFRKKHEAFSDNTPIFTARHTASQLGWSGTRSTIYRILSKSIKRNKIKNRYDVQADHGFRKRFNTILKMDNSVNYNIAEKLMGHKNGLDGVYFTPTLTELFAEFRKVIHKIEI